MHDNGADPEAMAPGSSDRQPIRRPSSSQEMNSQNNVATTRRSTRCTTPLPVPLTTVPIRDSNSTSSSIATTPPTPNTRPRRPNGFNPHAAS